MIQLTETQRQALAAEPQPCRVIDPETRQTYVLLPAEFYERLKALLYDDSEWTEDDLRLLLARSAEANGWDEPGMDAYDRYDEERQKRCP
jgi:hypothetical protein